MGLPKYQKIKEEGNMKGSINRKKLHYIELYKYNLMLIDTNNHKSIKKKYGLQYQHKGRYSTTVDYHYKKKNCIYLIFYSKAFYKYSKKKNAACIAHEMIHVVNIIFEARDIEFTYKHDEHYAYFVEYLYKLAHDFMKKYL